MFQPFSFFREQTYSPISSLSIEFLIIGGGGGGGGSSAQENGGGGGAGRLYTASLTLDAYATASITIGASGSGAITQNDDPGGNGGDSTIAVNNVLYTMPGGGGGGARGQAGLAGGSGGGGGSYSTGTAPGGGTNVSGNSVPQVSPAAFGFGVKGDTGKNTPSIANGGVGGGAGMSNANGQSTGYTWLDGVTYGEGGLGNGGAAATTYGGGGSANIRTGANGKAGVVVIRYSGSQRASGGTVTSSGGYTYHTFTSNGTFSNS